MSDKKVKIVGKVIDGDTFNTFKRSTNPGPPKNISRPDPPPRVIVESGGRVAIAQGSKNKVSNKD